jgi:NTE family protein
MPAHTNGRPDTWPRPLAFALSGGGSWGASQVGMLRALTEAGIRPDLVVGTSVGALNGAVVSAHPDDAADRLDEVWRAIDQATVFGGSRRRAVVTFLRSRGSHLSEPDSLQRLVASHLPVTEIEDLRLPLSIVVTDATTGEVVLLNRGRADRALMASTAIPGIFPSVPIDGREFIDGGVAANVPIRPALRTGAATVVVLDATPNQIARPSNRPVGRLLNTASLMLRSQAAADTEDLAPDRLVVRLPRATPDGYGSFNFNGTADLIDRGHRLTTDFLARL